MSDTASGAAGTTANRTGNAAGGSAAITNNANRHPRDAREAAGCQPPVSFSARRSGLFGKRDRVDVTPVVRLGPMDRAAIAEEARVGIGTHAEVLDPINASAIQPGCDLAGKAEQRTTGALRRPQQSLL